MWWMSSVGEVRRAINILHKMQAPKTLYLPAHWTQRHTNTSHCAFTLTANRHFFDVNGQFKVRINTPVPGKWKPPRGSRREKSMLNLYKDGFTLLPLKGQTVPRWLDDNWTWKGKHSGSHVSSGKHTGSRLLLLPVIVCQLYSISISMSRIWLMLFSTSGYYEYNSTSLMLDKWHQMWPWNWRKVEVKDTEYL